jgi:hypothetical protein
LGQSKRLGLAVHGTAHRCFLSLFVREKLNCCQPKVGKPDVDCINVEINVRRQGGGGAPPRGEQHVLRLDIAVTDAHPPATAQPWLVHNCKRV